MPQRYRIFITGVVQGVGFRPFVKKLADRFALAGAVSNTTGGVVIEIETEDPPSAEAFVAALHSEAPRCARIEQCEMQELETAAGYSSFVISASRPIDGLFTLISPDIATCAECLHDIFDPANRRFHYAFTNCTHCGPRYSITTQIPYDRPNTTMAPFRMCSECEAEYGDEANRRFHAQPNACPRCGPRLTLEPKGEDAMRAAVSALEQGRIVALKGLGGFQLACNALLAEAVASLRARKKRGRKPFAVMMRDLAAVERYCELSGPERELLSSPAAPIVLLKMRDPDVFPAAVTSGLNRLGVMLPYTPLHHLLFRGSQDCLVMTSGNISEEPIVISNAEARTRLGAICDDLLLHDREIFMRVDDSVACWFDGRPRILRRARGYVPEPIRLGVEMADVLACGAELKNTFCITKGPYAILSQHIGDMANYETLRFFEETLRNLKSVYRAKPRLLAHDLHPDYLATRWAVRQNLPTLAVQHHHAHIAACMAENGVRDPVIGVAFDGTGYGTDAQVWGGEFLICDYLGFRRAAHFRYVPLIGGDRAMRQAWRMAAAHLYDAFGKDYRRLDLPLWHAAPGCCWTLFDRLLQKPPLLTSSCGRLFDAIAALAGICGESSYEGEAAMLLETAAADAEGSDLYPIPVDRTAAPWTIDTRPMIRKIAWECARSHSAAKIAGAFHRTIGFTIEMICAELRDLTGLCKVCLSGGTFQNLTLLELVVPRLRAEGFDVFTHSQVPPNDGGLSLGQAVIAAEHLGQKEA